MALSSVSFVVESAIIAWLLCVIVGVLLQMANGRIVTAGLLGHSKTSGFTFHRLQLFVITLIFASGYAIEALRQQAGAGMPDIPATLLLVIFGSQFTYLGGVASNFQGFGR